MNTFNVNLERFSGPYYKILEMIEERKLSINEFSLAKITDEYISFIRSLKSINENNDTEKNKIDISEFIVIASTLMLIKARSLFPNITYTEEEEKEVSNLEKKLELYKTMSEASKNISKIFGKEFLYSLPKQENSEVIFVMDKRIDKVFLHSVAIATILKFPKIEKIKQVAVKQILKIEDIIEKLLDRVNVASSISFKDFSENVNLSSKSIEEKKSVFIISFLAMLELIKNGLLHADQDENIHNKIQIKKTHF
jgi:segregation and condensation protein A